MIFCQRVISEMSLCEAWQLFDSTPEGFTLNGNGKVTVYNGNKFPLLCNFHHYAVTPQSQVLCLFPGQFIALEESNLKPGDRIKIIQSKASDLITVFPNGLAILYGHTKEIEEKLGLFYS